MELKSGEKAGNGITNNLFSIEVGVRTSVVMLENSKIGVLLEKRNNVLLEDIQNIAPGSKITRDVLW